MYSDEQLLQFEQKLKPCPMCKGKDIGLYISKDDQNNPIYDVFCDGSFPLQCESATGYLSPEFAVDAWNSIA